MRVMRLAELWGNVKARCCNANDPIWSSVCVFRSGDISQTSNDRLARRAAPFVHAANKEDVHHHGCIPNCSTHPEVAQCQNILHRRLKAQAFEGTGDIGPNSVLSGTTSHDQHLPWYGNCDRIQALELLRFIPGKVRCGAATDTGATHQLWILLRQ